MYQKFRGVRLDYVEGGRTRKMVVLAVPTSLLADFGGALELKRSEPPAGHGAGPWRAGEEFLAENADLASQNAELATKNSEMVARMEVVDLADNAELVPRNTELVTRSSELAARMQVLEAEPQELRGKLGRNSGKPPSSGTVVDRREQP